MIEEVACAIIVGAITHQSVIVHKIGARIAKIERKLRVVEDNFEKHESRSLPPLIGIALIACFFMAACSPWRPTPPALPEAPYAAPAPSAGSASTLAPAPAPSQGARLEHASYLWGGWGIAVAGIGLLSAIGLFIFIPAMREVWIRQAVLAAAMLGCAITVWTFAPGMIYVFWIVSAMSVVSIVATLAYSLRKIHHA